MLYSIRLISLQSFDYFNTLLGWIYSFIYYLFIIHFIMILTSNITNSFNEMQYD